MHKFKSAKAYRRALDKLGKSYYVSKCTGATFRRRGPRKAYFKHPEHQRHKYKYVKTRYRTLKGYVIYRSKCSGSYHVRVFNARKKKYIKRYISKRYIQRLRHAKKRPAVAHRKKHGKRSHSRSGLRSSLPLSYSLGKSYHSFNVSPRMGMSPIYSPVGVSPVMIPSPVAIAPPPGRRRVRVLPVKTSRPKRLRRPNPKYFNDQFVV